MRVQSPTSRQIKSAMGVLAYFAATLGPSQSHEAHKCTLAIEYLEGEYAVRQESERILRRQGKQAHSGRDVRIVSCADCGERGHSAGWMECQYPQNH